MQEKPGRQSKLSVVSALKFFLKGNILFIFSSVTIYFFDIPTRIFPSLFQQVYTDNIITHKNPEWFAPLMVFYVSLFVIELAIWTSFSVIRRKSYARIIITLSTKYIWTVFRLPLSLLAQFIARALVRKPTVLFLDEATSALDNISQHIVVDNLAKLKCTRIVIAHRLSTIQQCNRIIVLKEGRVAADGNFEELQARGYFPDA